MNRSDVIDLKAFVPAKDFELSRRFYADLGFTENWRNEQVAEFEVGGFRFLLQNFYHQGLAENFMMHLHVGDADLWWARIRDGELQARYSLHMAKPPALQPWGLRVLFVSDPSGVLWHIAETPRS